ncbi:glycosyltransferase family 4 protein [Gammaproteobacteria bacterium]|nr:glycosyltransferase family 4 protein [Gammaproteobacteria bacterium]MDB3877683.1 glycosyltransferase family 4 protein [Gammaproteobacteria bacterium]MDC0089997.1 glycosyltransferase family 4 protein [Gammaproteobacteria bacterium]
MKKILILSFYYQPDLSAGSFRTTALVKSLNKTDLDLDIEVITTAPNRYSSFREKVEAFEVVDGVRIHRIAIPMHNSGMFDQSLAFISYYRQAIKIAKKSNYDLVFATSSRLFTAFLGARIARKKKVALYLDIRDIFVDTISGILSKALGILFVPWLNLIERYTFSTAKHINLVSEGFLRYFEKKKIDASFSFFTNGIDKEFDDITNIIRYETPSEKKLTILYAGNIGGGQGLHKIIPALAGRLVEHANFLVIGDGGQKEKFKNSIASMGLDNVELRDPIGRKQLIDEYVKADVLFLHLNNNPAFEKVLPSKLFEYASFNKPIFAGLSGYSVDFINAEISDCAVFMPCDIDDAVQKFNRLNLIVEPRIEFIKKYRREAIMTMMAANILLVLKDNA